MYVIPDVESYHIHDFKREKFPIPYNEEEFPNGFEHIEVYHGKDGKPKGISLLGAVDSVMRITEPSDMEKILKFIDEHRKVPYLMNAAIREAVERGKQNPLKPPRIGLPTLEEAMEIQRRISNI